MTDGYTRALLTLIALLLALDVAHGLGWIGAEPDETASRFTVVAIRGPGGPMLIRTDTATGHVWKRSVRDDAGGWMLLPDEGAPEARAGDEATSEAPEAAGEAPGGAPPSESAAPAPARSAEPAPPSPKDVEGYLTLLGDEDPGVRAFAAARLGQASGPEVRAALMRTLEDADASVVVAAIQALANLGPAEAEAKLRALARSHPDPSVQEAARKALAREG